MRKTLTDSPVSRSSTEAVDNAQIISTRVSSSAGLVQDLSSLAASGRERILQTQQIRDSGVFFESDQIDRDLEDSTLANRTGANSLIQSARRAIVTNLAVSSPTGKSARLYSVSLISDKNRGTSDRFAVRVTFDVPSDALVKKTLRSAQVFRRTDAGVNRTRPIRLSPMGLDYIRAKDPVGTGKQADISGMFELRARNKNVPNTISKNLITDPFTGLRVAPVSASAFQKVSVAGAFSSLASKPDTSSTPDALKSSDLSVQRDLNSIKNSELRTSPAKIDLPLTVGTRIIEQDSQSSLSLNQITDSKNESFSTAGTIISRSNSAEFKKIGTVVFRPECGRVIGDYVEFFFDDPTVDLGSTYSYYVVLIDDMTGLSPRSEIANIAIEDIVPPTSPKNVSTQIVGNTVSLVMTCDDLSVEKFEIYRIENENDNPEQLVIGTTFGESGYAADFETRKRLRDGFIQVGECLAANGTGVFRDAGVVPGRSYVYRVYSVDHFGNKSLQPFVFDFFFIEKGSKSVNLHAPSITAEVDSATGFIKLTLSSNDDAVNFIQLERKNLSSKQMSFTVPHVPDKCFLGNRIPSRAKIYDGAKVEDNLSWTGFFYSPKGEQTVFIDKLSVADQTYQYRVFGTDTYGNRTSYSFSRPVLASRRYFLGNPLNISASLVTENSSSAVRLTWDRVNGDIRPEDRIGDRNVLSASLVRTLYQVERRDSSAAWKSFPVQEELFLNDVISSDENSAERPEFLKWGKVYEYRVIAFQSGSYMGNFSPPISIGTVPPALVPENFTITFVNTKVRPLYVVLNWNSDSLYGWEIERAVVNNSYATRIPTDVAVSSLDFVPLARVYREASRGISNTNDSFPNNSPLFVGQQHIVDGDVSLGNSFYYRIRSVSFGNSKSEWVYRAVRLTDPLFEEKLGFLLTQEEKNTMLSTSKPMQIRGDFLK